MFFFFSSLVRSNYLFIILLDFIFTLRSTKIVKSSRRQVLFCLLTNTNSIIIFIIIIIQRYKANVVQMLLYFPVNILLMMKSFVFTQNRPQYQHQPPHHLKLVSIHYLFFFLSYETFKIFFSFTHFELRMNNFVHYIGCSGNTSLILNYYCCGFK